MGIASMDVSALRLAVYGVALLLGLVVSLALCLVAVVVSYYARREKTGTGTAKR
jgi:uncharacterized membrane protein